MQTRFVRGKKSKEFKDIRPGMFGAMSPNSRSGLLGRISVMKSARPHSFSLFLTLSVFFQPDMCHGFEARQDDYPPNVGPCGDVKHHLLHLTCSRALDYVTVNMGYVNYS